MLLQGRYIVCHANVTNKREVAQILKEEYPKFSIQEGPDDATPKCFDISRVRLFEVFHSSVQDVIFICLEVVN